MVFSFSTNINVFLSLRNFLLNFAPMTLKLHSASLLAALIAFLCLGSCNTDNDIIPGNRPTIEFDAPDGVYTVKVGHELRIDPIVGNAQNAEFTWSMNDKTLSHERALVMQWNHLGSFYVMLTVTSPAGTASEEARVDVVELTPPVIDLPVPAEGIYLLPGQQYDFKPRFSHSDVEGFRVKWLVDGVEKSTEEAFRFASDTEGTFSVTVKAASNDGEAEVTAEVHVVSRLPRSLTFESPSLLTGTTTRYTFPGRTVVLSPTARNIEAGAAYSWTVNGASVNCTEGTFRFTPTEPGNYEVMASADGATATVTVVCVNATEKSRMRPATGASSAYVSKVWEYVPAPGQFINDNSSIGGMPSDMASPDEACQWAFNRLQARLPVSLGACCGYIIAGFDHSVEAGRSLYDLAVGGNAFDRSNEPGTVWVMQDVNGNGIPDDEWYELRGSDYDNPLTIHNYAVTYHKPAGAAMDVSWTDNQGNSGLVNYLIAYHSQPTYYPTWISARSYTLRGTRLPARTEYNEVTGEWYTLPAEWGYADNLGSDTFARGNTSGGGDGQRVGLKISNAVMADGTPIELAYIDFVCIRSGIMANLGRIGESSTEVFSIADYRLSVN